MPSPYAHGLITVAIGMADQIIIATDATAGAADVGLGAEVDRAIELRPGFVVGSSGIWATADRRIDVARNIVDAFRHDDTVETFFQRYDRLYRHVLEEYLTARFRESPDSVLRECFCPVAPPHSLVICEVAGAFRRATIFEYIPTLRGGDYVALSPLIQAQEPMNSAAFAAIGAAAPLLDLLDPRYIEYASRGPRGPEFAARFLIEQAMVRLPSARGPVRIKNFPVTPGLPRTPGARAGRTIARREVPPPAALPIVDTKDLGAVQSYVLDRFATMYPNARLSWLPRLFKDVGEFFAGHHSDYAAVDLRYHDLEHTLQATLCATLIIEGRNGARVPPRIDAHYFELAITATLLHDSGYLKLRSDTSGTGAKYTFCHVLRGCAFAASYLPTLGANGSDVETVMGAINCTGPMNEISRLRFHAPVDEIIGCIVATADYLGQMAAVDYPDELTILFEEFKESDEFLHVPPENRAFKSAYDLIARTPHFWDRFVQPKLESDFHGVYRFLATPYPGGPNPYLNAIEANIAEVQRRAQSMAAAQTFTMPAELPPRAVEPPTPVQESEREPAAQHPPTS